jgi:hypothetical protein
VLPPAVIPKPTLPPPPPEEKDPKPRPEICGPTTAVSARDQAPASIEAGDRHRPQEGTYLFDFVGNYENGPLLFDMDHKVVSAATDVGEGFSFSIHDPFNSITWWFEAQPVTPTNANPGLFLQKVQIPAGPPESGVPQRGLDFTPAAPLKILNFPIVPGDRVRAAALDTASKSETPADGPGGQPLLTPSANTITSTVDVGSSERIIVCEELAQAWKINWVLQMAGEYNLDIIGSFWMGTQYGGWALKDEYSITGDLIPGNYASNLMKIDPGYYL